MTELVLLRAADESALAAAMTRVIGFLDRVPDASLTDVAYTCSLTAGKTVIAVIADNTKELRARLASALGRLQSETMRRIRDKSGTYYSRERLLGEGGGKLAFMYPGVMGYYPDMMRDLVIAYPPCRDVFDELEEAMRDKADFNPSTFIFPPAPYYRHDADIFRSGAYAQALVATYAGCAALTRLISGFGLKPDGVIGFAGGDLAAMMRSGSAGVEPSRPERISVIRDIYRMVDKAVSHGGLPSVKMLAVVLRHPGEIDELLASFPPDKVMVSVDFSPRRKTLAIAKDYAEGVQRALTEAGVWTMELEMDRPFNTPLCDNLVPAVRKFATTWMKHNPIYDVYSCATAKKVDGGIKAVRDDTAERWNTRVRLTETIRQMYADGYRVFLEVGPRGMMPGAVEDTLHGETFAAIALNSNFRKGTLQVQHAIGQLASLGAEIDISHTFVARGARRLDFDSAISMEVRKISEMALTRAFPKMSLPADESLLTGGDKFLAEPRGKGAKAAIRAAAQAMQESRRRRQQQFDFGALNPLISDGDLKVVTGVSAEVTKVFSLKEMPFLADYALGTSQVSYNDVNLRGLVLLSLSVGAELMAEVASVVAPNCNLLRIEDLSSTQKVQLDDEAVRLLLKGERVPSSDEDEISVKVQIRMDAPGGEFTWPVMEAVVVMSNLEMSPHPVSVKPLAKPRSVHWSGREIYPSRLCCGSRLRGIVFVEAWSEDGLDYEVRVPSPEGNVTFTRMPLWIVNPILLESIANGFPLWRSHERFAGAFSFPFKVRCIAFGGVVPKEDSTLKCYMRFAGVTPVSQLCDISVSDGSGQEVVSIFGWEELTERVPVEYRDIVLQPAVKFITQALNPEMLGSPTTDVGSAYLTDIPYEIFERNDEIWLKMLSHIVLDFDERVDFAKKTGSVQRRAEWLFGRITAKEAVRRFLKDCYQARWSNADVHIWAEESGKPHAVGKWQEYLSDSLKLDIAIAHTKQFVIALVAANAHAGVDVESVNRDLTDDFTAGVFTLEELELAGKASSAMQAAIRFWCAKEAVSKALGVGIRYSPKEMVVTSYQSDAGTIKVRLTGEWEKAFKAFKGRDIDVTVKTVHEHVIASCFIPASLFNES